MLDFIRIACAVPDVAVANVKHNAEEICKYIAQADEQGVDLLVFPELSLTGASCADLFFEDALYKAVKKGLPQLEMIAEDLGFLTQEVLDLRDNSGFPGMKVLEFAFDSREPSDYLPHTYTKNSVVYTGTHDNMTMRQWFETASKEAKEYAIEFMSLTEKEGLVLGTIRTAMSSVSDMCIIQMPDWLNLGGEARMNFPGTLSDCNWTWRAKDGVFTEKLAEKILAMTRLYGRLGAQKETDSKTV